MHAAATARRAEHRCRLAQAGRPPRHARRRRIATSGCHLADDVDVKGVLNVAAAVLPQMIKQHSGHVFNTSSIAGRKVFGQGFAVYSASKFAVTAFTEGLRMEVGKKHNIRVTSIQPGIVATELPAQTTSAEYQAMMAGYAGTVRMLDPMDIADTILFAAQAPSNVNIAEVFVLPTDQV
ncbi:SDR family oxidoreductase [Xanthomonas arboricola]|nr:SDR family NAD(P)-dependent oxidoreductase [Xanthomonas arboricola]